MKCVAVLCAHVRSLQGGRARGSQRYSPEPLSARFRLAVYCEEAAQNGGPAGDLERADIPATPPAVAVHQRVDHHGQGHLQRQADRRYCRPDEEHGLGPQVICQRIVKEPCTRQTVSRVYGGHGHACTGGTGTVTVKCIVSDNITEPCTRRSVSRVCVLVGPTRSPALDHR